MGSYRPIRKPPNKICLWMPGVMPFHSAPTPSSLATVAIVPTMPLYLGFGPPFAAAPCSCRRTFAVSMGIVHASANDAENALAARLPTKLVRSPIAEAWGGGGAPKNAPRRAKNAFVARARSENVVPRGRRSFASAGA